MSPLSAGTGCAPPRNRRREFPPETPRTQHEDFFIVGQIARDGEEVFNVFHRQNRFARRDLAEYRGVRDVLTYRHGLVEQFNGAWFCWIAADITSFLELV